MVTMPGWLPAMPGKEGWWPPQQQAEPESATNAMLQAQGAAVQQPEQQRIAI